MDSKNSLLIIGGSGFIGRNLISRLKDKYLITSLSKNSSVDGVSNIHVDLAETDFSFLEKESFDAAVYLGTISSPKEAEAKPQEAFHTNVIVVQKFLEKAREVGIKKIILFSSAVLYTSSDAKSFKETDEVAKNSSIYNYSKYLLETLAEYYRVKHDMAVTVFRLSNTYGPGQNNARAPYLIPGMFEQALKNKKIEVWNTSPVRDWVFIEDVVSVISKELKVAGGGIFNLGSGKGTSVGGVVEIVSKLTSVKYTNLDKPVNPPYHVVCDVNELKKRINYIPDTSLTDGLKKSLEYYKDIYK